jgi:alpha-beta hydrolase superfamily lysophospholipase
MSRRKSGAYQKSRVSPKYSAEWAVEPLNSFAMTFSRDDVREPTSQILAVGEVRSSGGRRREAAKHGRILGDGTAARNLGSVLYPAPMPSLLDDPALSEGVFFPRASFAPPPPGARDAMIEVAPGVRLHARIHHAPGAIAVLVLFHGNGEVVSDYDDAAPRFADAGALLVVVDFRGYGRSEGRSTVATLFSDACPAFEGLAADLLRAGVALPLVVMGRSLGSACAAEIARALPGGVAGVVFESGFSDVAGFARRRGVSVGVVPEADQAVLSPLHKLAASAAPLLVLHGERDTLLPPSEGRAAYEASGAADKRIVLVPGRGHNDVSFHPLYWEALAAFLGRVAGAPRDP